MRTIPASTLTAPNPTPVSAPQNAAPRPAAAHHNEPSVAAALFAVWSGDAATVICSPPGAGKTRLVTHLSEQLTRRAGLDVAIAAQTRAQALDVANRAAALGANVALLAATGKPRPGGLDPPCGFINAGHKLRAHHGVIVATTARWLWTPQQAWRADVLIVDEAWQQTFADLGSLGALADQVLLVGDPGQIDPVVTGETSRWDTWSSGPHQPAPDALIAAHADSVTQQRLTQTWRLGPATTALIQPTLYPDLPFTSARPPRSLTVDGTDLPELASSTIHVHAGPHDPALAATAAARVRDLLTTAHLNSHDEAPRALRPEDLAVIAPHVAQAAMIAAHLADLPGVLVGTTNSVQGLEREAVVVVHPLAGYRDAPDFATSTGRLCVALSRHRTHAHVILDSATATTLADAHHERPADTAITTQQHILTALQQATR